ncbi:MAG: hypothetical protein MUF05_06790 [Candidatus Omnitrophica bacterium]|nr:hypothetical protein [Candidatus Omnitrophota bacterium]
MNKKGKVAIIILTLLIIISLALSGGLYYLLNQEKLAKAQIQQQLEDVRAEQKLTKMKLEDSKKTIFSLEDKLSSTEKKVSALNTELENEKAAKQDAMDQIGVVKAELNKQVVSKDDLAKQLSRAQEENKTIQARLAELENKKIDLEVKIKDLEEKSRQLEEKFKGVQLGTIVVSPEDKPQAVSVKKNTKEEAREAREKQKAQEAKLKLEEKIKKDQQLAQKKQDELKLKNEEKMRKEMQRTTKKYDNQQEVEAKAQAAKEAQKAKELARQALLNPEGSIAVVNREYDFVVLNIGEKDGVKAGDTFQVSRNNKLLGEVNVEKVHDSMSAAGFASAGLKEVVQEGDKVIKK